MGDHKISINDVIGGIIAFLGAKEEFPVDNDKIHETFYLLAQEEPFKDLFKELKFSESRYYHKMLLPCHCYS